MKVKKYIYPAIKIIAAISCVIFVSVVFGMIIYEYYSNFHDMPKSRDPAAWGQLGDYFGGMLNPTISAVTLIFVAMTYLSQKNEIKRLGKIANETEIRRNTEALHQMKITERRDKLSLNNIMLSAKYKEVEFLYSEIKRASEHIHPSNTNQGRMASFYLKDGIKVKDRDGISDYIINTLGEIKEVQRSILQLMEEINVIDNKSFVKHPLQ